MTLLLAMPDDFFERFVQETVAGYANDCVASGRWSKELAFSNSRAELDKLLPNGLKTPDQRLFLIQEEPTRAIVGTVWFAETVRDERRMAYVYDLRIYPEFQRRGHATRALQQVEQHARVLGLSGIALHVFGHNAAAQALYTKLGFAATNVVMVKNLVHAV